jgi:LytS/YehU family sensor histidine kinase
MERARLEAELEALGREVDPHFLFNNLNALVHLVDQQRSEAPAFVNALSLTYQYVLDSRGKRLVPLAEELAALRRHETLATIRFGKGVVLALDVDHERAARLQLPPVTLGELFQNAIKHNAATPEAPLRVCVRLDDNTLAFENEVRARNAAAASTGIGLTNLAQRFQLATGRAIAWGVEGERFVIRLPLVG